MLVSETKIDDNFPQGQFVLDGFSVSSRLDCNCLGGDLMLFVREDVPSDLLKIEEKPVVNLYVELNWPSNKWLVNWSYNPHKTSIGTHLDLISKSLDFFSFDYEAMIFLGDFIVTDDEHNRSGKNRSEGYSIRYTKQFFFEILWKSNWKVCFIQ